MKMMMECMASAPKFRAKGSGESRKKDSSPQAANGKAEVSHRGLQRVEEDEGKGKGEIAPLKLFSSVLFGPQCETFPFASFCG
jgi:hypothetical protein